MILLFFCRYLSQDHPNVTHGVYQRQLCSHRSGFVLSFFFINLLDIPALPSNKEYRMANSVKGKFNKFKNMHILDQQQCKYCEEEEKIQQEIESNKSSEINSRPVKFLFIKMK
jgi:hypothetical protein